MKPDDPHPRFGISRIQVSGFRTARDVSFSPGQLCALVGEADAGKSNLLAAIRAVLDPAAAPVTVADTAEGGDGSMSIRVELADGGEASLERTVGHDARVDRDGAPPRLLFLPAAARADEVLAAGATAPDSGPGVAPEIFQRALEHRQPTAVGRALSLVDALEQCCARRLAGLLLLVEEPELFLRPQAQRYLYRLLREFSMSGNQAIYSTHSPAFLG